MSTRTVAGINVPDTPVITAAIDLARNHLDDWAYNHIMRSWLLGIAIADRIPDFANRDRELHSVAAILHDMGWDEKNVYVSKDKCFEVDGANAARSFVEQQSTSGEWDQHRKQVLWDAIALHTHPPVALYKEPEVAACLFGIRADFVGPDGVPGGALPVDEWKAVSKEFPRKGFKSGTIQKFCGFCRDKPETTYLTIAGDFGENFVEGYTKKGNRLYDVVVNAVETD